MLARLKFNMTFMSTDYHNVYISKNEILLIINQQQKEFLKELFIFEYLHDNCGIKHDVLFYFNYKLFVASNVSLDNMFEIINN